METKLVLTPMQLFYLGSLLDASYIDYSYVSAIESFQESYNLVENEIKNELILNGVISEDFSGDLIVEDNYSELLRPIFHGNKEIEIDEYLFSNNSIINCYKYHFCDNKITCICFKDDCFEATSVTTETIERLINDISSKYKKIDAGSEQLDIENIEVSGLLTVKYLELNKESIVRNYLISNQTIIQVKDNDELERVFIESFCEDTISLVKR